MLRTPLLRLANIMLLLRIQLCLAITCNTRNSTAYRTRNAVGDAGAEIVDLALGFLGFALGILFLACALEVLFKAHVSISCQLPGSSLKGDVKCCVCARK